MAIQTVRVGAYLDEAAQLFYDYDDTTNKVVTIRYKNSTGLTCHFAIYQEPGHTELFRHILPANTNNTLTRNLSVAQRPDVPGANMSVSFGCG